MDGAHDKFANDRDFCKSLNGRFFQYWHHGTLADFLNHQRHCDDDVGLHIREGFHQQCRGGGFGQEMDMAAVGERVEELRQLSVHVRQRQHGDHVLTPSRGQELQTRFDVGGEAAVGEHHPFRVTRGTGGVVDEQQVVKVADGENMVVLRHIKGLAGNFHALALRGDEGEIRQRDDRFEVRHVLGVHVFPHVRPHNQQARFGVVDERFDVLSGELVQHGDDDRAVGGDGEVGDGPFGAVTSAERDFVALTDAHLFEKFAQTCGLLRHLLEGVIVGAVIVGQRGFVPVFWKNFVIMCK